MQIWTLSNPRVLASTRKRVPGTRKRVPDDIFKSQQRNTTSTQENQSDQTKGEDNDQPTSTAPIETTDEEELTWLVI
ncbi:hypothetical protein PGT21_022053 [Puccinia graminis f. sp. tritici]|uniref:Uncharacterized protein n=1 Tax=Puccinia graminis f. sp. tritici TaxID=56615 RepID=A0A5B0QWS1_PUCGR|nr:hypothetical protein PGT21_022053 [Puccinia graminis f. sp. tritici]